MEKSKYEIMYVVSDLKRVGPSNQTLNIIKNSPISEKCIVITLFNEPIDTMIDEYKQNNIEVISLNLNKKFFLLGVKKLKKYISKFNVKIVHSYGVRPDSICQKAIKGQNVKHIITLRNFPKEDIFTRMNKFKGMIVYCLHIRTLLRGKYIIACSNTIKDKMIKEYNNINIETIQNGVDIQKYNKALINEKEKLRKKYEIDLDKKVIISTSSFIPRKRIEETIIAFQNCHLNNKILLLLGTGSEYDKLLNKYKSDKNICFIGKTDRVSEYLKISDLFLSSSESEGLPNGVIEAIASGIPVVLSDIPQHKEILNEVKNAGVLYELGNIEEFTKTIEDNIDYDNSQSDISKSNLTMKKMSEYYYNYYKKILEEITEDE